MNYGWFVKLDNRAGHYGLLVAAAAGLFFLNLGGPTLWDLDEGKNATAAFEMMESDNWIRPTFNAELRVDKPALLYWLQIFAYQLFGINEFAARFPSALAGLLTLFVAYELGRSMFGRVTGLLTGLVTASTPMQIAAARFANPDALLHLFTCLTLLIFWTGLPRRGWAWFAGMGATMGLAGLAKGPVGLLLPAAVAGLFLIWNRQLSVLRDRRWWLTFLTFFLVAMPWYILVTIETKANFLRGFLGTHHLDRFLTGMEEHGEGPLFYVLVLAVGFVPWSVFLPLAGWIGLLSAVRQPWSRCENAWNRLAERPSASPTMEAYRFLWSWAAMFLVFYSLSATKLPNYILPATLPLGVIVARFWDRWRTGEVTPADWMLRTGVVWLGISGILIGAGLFVFGGGLDLPAMRHRSVPGLVPWVFLSAIPLAGSAVGLWLFHRQQRQKFLTGLMTLVILFLIPVASWTVIAFNQVKAALPMIEEANAAKPERDIRLACYQMDYLPSLNFYSRREVEQFRKEQDALDFFRTPMPAYLFVPETHWQVLQTKLSGPYRVLGRHADLYRGTDVVVVTNQ